MRSEALVKFSGAEKIGIKSLAIIAVEYKPNLT